MAITINGTTGIAGVDGSASTPSYQGADTNTGIFYPAADTIAFAEGGAEVMRIDSSGNVGIGTSSPSRRLDVRGGIGMQVNEDGAGTKVISLRSDFAGVGPAVNVTTNDPLLFLTNNTERARINSSGALLINRTTQVNTERFSITGNSSSQCMALTSPITGGYDMCNMNNGNGQVGVISTSGTSTAYTTSSDYRLKENVAPMTGALATISQLNPVTYTWKVDGSVGQGFIAHELQAVVPDAVSGEKDAVDADGKPRYQGVDTSFLVATLTAAIQELKAELDTTKARLAALEAN